MNSSGARAGDTRDTSCRTGLEPVSNRKAMDAAGRVDRGRSTGPWKTGTVYHSDHSLGGGQHLQSLERRSNDVQTIHNRLAAGRLTGFGGGPRGPGDAAAGGNRGRRGPGGRGADAGPAHHGHRAPGDRDDPRFRRRGFRVLAPDRRGERGVPEAGPLRSLHQCRPGLGQRPDLFPVGVRGPGHPAPPGRPD